MIILGIESSCDETAAAIVEDGRRVYSNAVQSQIDIHHEYGGVVPEIAARSHIEAINPVIRKALRDSGLGWDDIDAIAVAYAPGLVGSLLVGTLAARTLAVLHDKPLYPVHHVEAHIYANFITDQAKSMSFNLPLAQPKFPMIALAVSGLHSQLVYFRGHGDYVLMGQTLDDAVGEAFDKVAKILGFGYPGGPVLEQWAQDGDAYHYDFPVASLQCPPGCTHDIFAKRSNRRLDRKVRSTVTSTCRRYDFSFSGLKTAVLRAVQRELGKDVAFPSHQLGALLNDAQRHNFAASFVRVAIQTLVDKTLQAYNDLAPVSVVIAGGVAASPPLRREMARRFPVEIEYAPMSLCTDNAAMIASLGYYYSQTCAPCDPYSLEVKPSLSMQQTPWSENV